MRNFLGSAMVIAMALCFISAVLPFGGVTLEWIVPAYAFGAACALLWAVKLVTSKLVSWKHSPMHGPVLAFFLFALFRYFTSPIESVSRLELFHIGFYTLLYFVCAINFYHSKDRAVLLGTVLGVALFESGYAIWQVATQSNLVYHVVRPAEYDGRGSGTYICPNHLSGLLEMSFALLACRAAFYHGKKMSIEKGTLRKVIIVYAALMTLAGIAMTFSRGGWMATLAAFLAMLLWGDWRLKPGWPRFAMAGVGLLAVLFVAWNVSGARDRIGQSDLDDLSAGGRTLMWQSTVSIIRASPWLGTGPGTWPWFYTQYRSPDLQARAEYAHSDVLQVFSDYGAVGGAIVLAFFACFFWQASRLMHRKTPSEQRSFAIGGSVAMIALLAHSWLDFNLHIPANATLMVLIAGFVAAISDSADAFPRRTLGTVPRILLALVLLAVLAAGGIAVARKLASDRLMSYGIYTQEIAMFDMALDYYQQAAAKDPRNPHPWAAMGEVYLTQSQWRLGEDNQEARRELASKAVEMFEASLALNPHQTVVLLQLAKAWELLEDTPRALAAFDRARAVDPNNSRVYMRLGLFYRHLEDETNAALAFQKSEELNQSGHAVSRSNLEEFLPRR